VTAIDPRYQRRRADFAMKPIKHTMGPVSIKMYDKFQLILRIETTVVNVSFFKHYRQVEHEDGTRSMAWAEMRRASTVWPRYGNS